MGFLSGMRFSRKLGLMTGAAVLGFSVFAALAFMTLQAVRINSAMYQSISLGYQLAGDCYDPPASLVAALPPAIAAEDATNAADTRKAVGLLLEAHRAFTASQQHYHAALPPGAIRDLMANDSAPAGEEWFTIAEQEYIPALLAGDHEGARRIRIQKMDVIFARHKAANDRLANLTADWIPTEEKHAAAIIRTRSIELGAIFAGLVLLLVVLGSAISRGIVRPVGKVLEALSAMAQGDLSHRLEVESADEMGEMAAAFNQTAESFRAVLTAISQAAAHTAAGSAELNATALDTTGRSSENAHEAQQVAAAMVQMSASIAEVTEAATSAANSGAATESAAQHGHRVVEETMSVIRRSAEVTAEAAEQIRALGESSEQISRIVSVINEIAGQTNLLALNAAIEAARAGEQGRGFAVVAGEVRRLAERTTQATREIGTMIETVQQRTSGAVEAMHAGQQQVSAGIAKAEECGSALKEIVSLAHEAEKKIRRIAVASNEQNSAAEEITRSMSSISQFTEHSSTSGEQIAAACGDLAKVAAELEAHVHRFSFTR